MVNGLFPDSISLAVPSPSSALVRDSSPQPKQFDVFLSHNSKDKTAVRELAEALKAHELEVWFDECELIPGRSWQKALEDIIRTAKSAAVLVGKDGLGPWEDMEMRGCLEAFVKRGMPVIPVLLLDAPQEPELPLFLTQFTWVDLRNGQNDAGINRLLWGITGQKQNSPLNQNGLPGQQGICNGATGTSQGPRTAPGPDEKTRKLVNDKIAALLQDPSLKSILASIGKQLTITTTDDHLLALDSAKQLTHKTVADALTKLNISVFECLKSSILSDMEWQKIEEIIGWLVILTVDPDWLAANRSSHNGSTGNVRLEIPAETKIGVEAAVACLFKKNAQFQKDPAETLKLVPSNAHYTGILETGVDLDNRYRHILTNIHYALFKGQSDTNKWGTLEEFLNETIRLRNEVNGENHYVLLENIQDTDKKTAEALIERLGLLDKLPVINIVASGKVLTVKEPPLAAQIYNIMVLRTN